MVEVAVDTVVEATWEEEVVEDTVEEEAVMEEEEADIKIGDHRTEVTTIGREALIVLKEEDLEEEEAVTRKGQDGKGKKTKEGREEKCLRNSSSTRSSTCGIFPPRRGFCLFPTLTRK